MCFLIMRWIANLNNRGPRRVNQAAVLCDQTILAFGGYSQEVSTRELKYPFPIDVHALSLVSLRWAKRPLPGLLEQPDQFKKTPYFRYGHACVYYKEQKLVYLFGGRCDWATVLCNTLFAYDPKTHLWSIVKVNGFNPDGRDGHSATVAGNSMYIFGGYVQSISRFSNDMHEFNFNTFTWTTIVTKTDLQPHWRDFHTATLIDKKIYIFGGRMDTGGDIYTGTSFYSNDLYSFDTVEHVWKEILPQLHSSDFIPKGRRSHSAVPYKNRIVFFGGFDENLLEHYSDLFEFNTTSSEWRKINALGDYPSERRRHCCCVDNNRMYLFGGTGPEIDSRSSRNRISNLRAYYRSLLEVMTRNYQIINNMNNNNNNANVNNDNNNNDNAYQEPDDNSVSIPSDGEDFNSDGDEFESEEDFDLDQFDRKLQSKSDLHLLNLDVPSLRELAISNILVSEVDYKNSGLPLVLKNEIESYSESIAFE